VVERGSAGKSHVMSAVSLGGDCVSRWRASTALPTPSSPLPVPLLSLHIHKQCSTSPSFPPLPPLPPSTQHPAHTRAQKDDYSMLGLNLVWSAGMLMGDGQGDGRGHVMAACIEGCFARSRLLTSLPTSSSPATRGVRPRPRKRALSWGWVSSWNGKTPAGAASRWASMAWVLQRMLGQIAGVWPW
jgi:hypothetical protein